MLVTVSIVLFFPVCYHVRNTIQTMGHLVWTGNMSYDLYSQRYSSLWKEANVQVM